jgi:hypothetical protein
MDHKHGAKLYRQTNAVTRLLVAMKLIIKNLTAQKKNIFFCQGLLQRNVSYSVP